jgi:hypothetical protein
MLIKELLKDGIGSIIIESPYYGLRKPPEQAHSKVLHVSDLILLGAVTIIEALWFVHMLRAAGVPKVCFAGDCDATLRTVDDAYNSKFWWDHRLLFHHQCC